MTPDPVNPESKEWSLEELSAPEVARRIGLEPHPEGGFFRQTYRSSLEVQTEAGPRPLSTAILYLLTAQEPSHLHRLRSDELWFYHAGAPAELVLLRPGSAKHQVIGLDSPQILVPAQTWLGARVMREDQTDWGAGRAPERRWTPDRRLSPELHWTLVSCVVAPGFDYEDFELGDRKTLLSEYPQERKAIIGLT